MSNVHDFGTAARKLRRRDHPDTSQKSAARVNSTRFEELAYQIILRHGLEGCIADQLRDAFAVEAPPRTQFINRRTGIHQKGLVLDTGHRRRGDSGREQAVYVARVLLTPEWLEFIRNHPLANNPCLRTDEG